MTVRRMLSDIDILVTIRYYFDGKEIVVSVALF